MPPVEISPTKGAAVNISADGAVTVVTWWAPLTVYPSRPSDLYTLDGDRLDWQTVTRPDIGRIVKTIMDNIGVRLENGPVTVIEAPPE